MRAIAGQFADTADFIEGVARNALSRLTFGGATAGRAHIAHGDALRMSLSRLADELSEWARASVEIAVALRATADSYADAELRSAARIG